MREIPICFVAITGLFGCAVDDRTAPESETVLEHDLVNPMLFSTDARPFGRSLERWSELLWSWIYAQPFDRNPLLDPTGEDCAGGEHGPMWFLASVPGSSLGTNVSRSCTIPEHKAILLQLSSLVNDYPCPDPTFHPAPGQSLFDFLIEPVTPIFDGYTGVVITFDGVDIVDPLSYRFTSDDLFLFKGDVSMQAFDSCITGRIQPAVSDGFYLPFKPMVRGAHTIVIDAHDMTGVPVTLTWHLIIR
jgi:hypothetical protein